MGVIMNLHVLLKWGAPRLGDELLYKEKPCSVDLVKFLDILKNCVDVFLFSIGITKSPNVYLWMYQYGLCVCDTYKTANIRHV